MLTIKSLQQSLGIGRTQAETVFKLTQRKVSPFSVAETAAWADKCYSAPRQFDPETIMHAINATIGAYGTEAIFDADGSVQPVAEYCNTGDTYNATILYDYVAGRYRLTTMGDFVERYGRRYGLDVE